MDKCKYYLNIDGLNVMFNSDAELTEFVRDNITSKPDSKRLVYEKETKKAIDLMFSKDNRLSLIGTPKQYAQYLSSKGITNVAFHHTNSNLTKFEKVFPDGYYATHAKHPGKEKVVFFVEEPLQEEFMSKRPIVTSWGLVISNPLMYQSRFSEGVNTNEPHGGIELGVTTAMSEGYDGVIFGEIYDNKTRSKVIAILDSDNAFRLGTEEDLKDFMEFVKNNPEVEKPMYVKYSKVESGTVSKQEELWKRLKEPNPLDPFSRDILDASEFLEKQHVVDGELKYLSPVFIQENYVELAVKDLVEGKNEVLTELAKTDRTGAERQAKDIVLYELALDERMKRISITTAIQMESIINKSVKIEDAVDKILYDVAVYNVYSEWVKLNNAQQQDELVKEYIANNFKGAIRTNMIYQLDKWYRDISTSQDLFTANVKLARNKPGDPIQLKTRIPYIGVSKEGVVSVYQIKVSRNDFNKWHSSKVKVLDYQLGIHRQLLQNITQTRSSSLYVLPVVFPEKDGKINAEGFYIGDLIDRSRYDAKSGLDDSGNITETLRKLLPARVIANIEESSGMHETNREILAEMFGRYNFRTRILNTDAQKRFDNIVKKAEGQPKLKLWNNIDRVFIEEDNTPEGREKFKQRVFEYTERESKAEHSRMVDLTKAILTAKKNSSDGVKKEILFGKSSAELQNILGKYLTDDWELVVDRPELLNGGILLFRNANTLTFEIVSVTVNTLDQTNDLGFGNTLLGKFKKNEFFKADDKILKATNGNIEIIKALTIINNNPELVEGYALNSVRAFDSLMEKGQPINLELALYNFDLLINEVKKFRTIENNFAGKNPKIRLSNFSKILYQEILNALGNIGNSKSLKSYLSQVGNLDDLADNKRKLDWLIKLREQMLLSPRFKAIADANQRQIENFSNPEEFLFYIVSSGIAYFAGLNSVFDVDTPQYGIRAGDALHWVRTLLFGSAPEFDERGNRIVGLFQGQHFNTTDNLESVYMRRIHDLIAIAQNKIRHEFNLRKAIIVNNTKKYYEETGRLEVERMLIGDADKYHEVFFEKHNGKITNDFKLKDPWDPRSNLTDSQRGYLKQFVHNQYISRKGSNLQLDTLQKFERSEEFAKMRENGSFELLLKPPLIKKQAWGSRLKNLTTEGLWKYIGQSWDSIKTAINPRDLTQVQEEHDKQLAGVYNSINGFRQMYNQFDSQESEELRNKMIEEYGVGFFEVNLDTIALKYAFEGIREKYYNNILPVIYSAITTLKFYGWQNGKVAETEKALNDFFDQLNISVFDIPIVKNKEVEELMGGVRTVQKVASLMALALRPALMVKELTVGLFKNTSYAWSKIYGDDSFKMEYLMGAYGLLLKPSQKDFDIIYELNNEYAIANRDLNQIVDKVKVDRLGINFFGNMMYWFNTAPDHINRNALFLSKMLHDDSYKAHSINEEGQLIYDPSKDGRYEYYFSKREQYGMKFHPTDKKYNDQRSLYLYAIDEFNGESITMQEKPLTEKDRIPRAYFAKEKESIKTFSDTAYGYYDHERSPLEKHTVLGIMFGQFMTFWPSKMRYYWSPPGKSTKKGHMVQKYRLLEDGSKEYYFVRFTIDPETGEEFREEVPESQLRPDEPRVKAWFWDGDVYEGLMYSLALTTRALFSGELDQVSDQRMANTKVMLHDILMALLAILLGYFLMQEAQKPEKEKMEQYEKVAMKILTKATGEFNPVLLVTQLQTTPAFVSILSKAGTEFKDVISGDTSLERFLRRNIALTELIPNPATR